MRVFKGHFAWGDPGKSAELKTKPWSLNLPLLTHSGLGQVISALCSSVCRFPTSYTSLIFPGFKLQLGQDLVLKGDRNFWNFPMKCSPASPGAEWQHPVLGGLTISQGQIVQQVKKGVLRHQAQNFNPSSLGLGNLLANWFSSSFFFTFSLLEILQCSKVKNEWMKSC